MTRLALLLMLSVLLPTGSALAASSEPDTTPTEAEPEETASEGEAEDDSGKEASKEASTCGADCAKPCCAKKEASTCGADCAKPCCAKKEASTCGADCAKPCCAKKEASTCGADCAKPCCAKKEASTCTKGGKDKAGCNKSGCAKKEASTCTKGGKDKAGCNKSECKGGSCSVKRRCGSHGHRHKLRLPAGISIVPIARVQVRATLFDQDDADANDPVVYGDPGLREGISLRRVRVGIEASWKDIIHFRVVGGWDNRFDALSSAPSYPTLVEALFRVSHILPIELEAGLGRVPFGRQAQASSAHLALVERSLASEYMSPLREPLVALRGAIGPKDNKVLPEGALRWAIALSNGDSPWSGDPNPSPRLSGRLSLDLGKAWRSQETGRDASGFGLSVGGSINHNWGLEARTLTGGVDLGVQIWRVNIQGELLLANATPTFDTEGLPSLLSERSSMGWYGQLGVVIIPGWLELAARAGGYDDNRALSDAGDRLDVGGGVNFFLFDGHFKAQLHYMHRTELSDGYATDNDSLVLQVQALL